MIEKHSYPLWRLSNDHPMETRYHFDGLVQERRNSIANALGLRLSCANPSIYDLFNSRWNSFRIRYSLRYPATGLHVIAIRFGWNNGWSPGAIMSLISTESSVVLVKRRFSHRWVQINTLRPRQNGRHFADDIFKCIFLMKMFEFRLKFQWSLFLRVQLTVFQHWFR